MFNTAGCYSGVLIRMYITIEHADFDKETESLLVLTFGNIYFSTC